MVGSRMKYYLITTRLSTQRIVQSTELLAKIGVHWEPVWGYEKHNIPKDIYNMCLAPEAGSLTEGEKAVALSHLKALRKVIDSNEPGIIIEDDFRLWHEGKVTHSMVREGWETVPENTDFCSFSKWHVFNPDINQIDPDEHPTHKKVELPTYGNQSYYISHRAANHFYRENLPVRAAADVIYRYAPHPDFIYRHHFPELIWHRDSSLKDD